MSGRKIEKIDSYGSTKLSIENEHDDFYLYCRISGMYFMLFAFGFGFLLGIGTVLGFIKVFYQR